MENNIFQPEVNNEENLLAPEDYVQYVYASQGQRFLNYLIDNILMRFGLSYLSGMFLGLLLRIVAPDFLQEISYVISTGGNIFSSLKLFGFLYFVGILNYLFYYSICEKIFKGYTLGKIITGTRAIRQDGNELTFKDAFMRSLSRLVPFEVFSGFSTLTWHDSWTNTMVIKSR